MGTLYVVATPIGNLEDITLRALRILREVDVIAAEDTRTTGRLLKHFQIDTTMVSHYAPRERAGIPRLVEALQGGDVALVSEAGMPGISDPGHLLVKAAIEAGAPVVPIPGASAITSALAVSGLSAEQFVYLGFLPRRGKERRSLLAELAAEWRTLVAFEAPHRLMASLRDIRDVLGDRRLAVARELTKLYEEVFRGSVAEAIGRFEAERPRGELTLVIEGATEESPWSRTEVLERIRQLDGEGLGSKELAGRVAEEASWRQRDVYRLITARKEEE